jgi:DnaK suppressor protein
MNKEQASPHQQKLMAMHTSLLEQIAAQRGGASRAEAAAEHFSRREDSSAQVATERELEFAIDDREAEELVMIDSALARIEGGIYGECIDCGTDIAPARLQASPEVPRCIACQEKFEHRHLA